MQALPFVNVNLLQLSVNGDNDLDLCINCVVIKAKLQRCGLWLHRVQWTQKSGVDGTVCVCSLRFVDIVSSQATHHQTTEKSGRPFPATLTRCSSTGFTRRAQQELQSRQIKF